MRAPDYSKYTRLQLIEALESIDKLQFPENYNSLLAELDKPERNCEELIAKDDAEEERKSIDFKGFFLIAVSTFCFFWSYFAFNRGVIHTGKGTNSKVLATLEDDYQYFMFIVVSVSIVGLAALAYGIRTICRNNKT